jgi:hypothetical protein
MSPRPQLLLYYLEHPLRVPRAESPPLPKRDGGGEYYGPTEFVQQPVALLLRRATPQLCLCLHRQ